MATVKYQAWAPYVINPSFAVYKAWAQVYGAGMAACGWTPAGTPGEVNWANVIALPSSVQASSSRNWRGAWVHGAAYAIGDVVTDGGLTYVNIVAEAAVYAATAVSNSAGTSTLTGTFTGAGSNAWAGLAITISGFTNSGNNNVFVVLTSSTTTLTYTNASGVTETHAAIGVIETGPGTLHGGSNFDSALSTSHWLPYNYEIWQSTGPLSGGSGAGTLYLFMQYGLTGVGRVEVQWSVSTVMDANGTFTGNQTNGGTLQLLHSNGTNGVAGTNYEYDFCGDADNIAFIAGRDLASFCAVLIIDRARDTSGNALASYTTVLKQGASSPTYQILFAQGLGPALPLDNTWPTINGTLATTAAQGGVAVLPIFPLPGYVASPVLGGMCMRSGDFVDGELLSVVVYGTSHTFMMTQNATAIISNVKTGIRWEVV
jgi:hypothetical protein